MFLICSQAECTLLSMTDDPANLRPADPDELRLATSSGRFPAPFRRGDDVMTKLVADHFVRHLEDRNYVILRRPLAPGHSTPPVSSTGPR
jgi:hypothetical protein